MRLETRLKKPYKRVPVPVARYKPSKVVSKPPAPPAVSPKPGSKVYLYVYDSEPENPSTTPQYYPNPHFTRQSSLEPIVQYPHAKEKKVREDKNESAPPAPQRSGRQRVREQGRKSDKGYKVLAEVTPQLRSSSRGGKMFIRQKQRMENFTKESQNNNPEENHVIYGRTTDSQGASDTWASPWNLATKSPTAVKYITAKRLAGPMNNPRRGLKDPLGFLPKPPDFWRARVEQNFPNNGLKVPPPVRPRSSMRYNSEHTPSVESNRILLQRPDSAPPVESPSFYENHHNGPIYDPNSIYDEYDEDEYFRPGSIALPGATIHFNAKQYYTAPHRRQGLRRGWNVCTTTPFAHKDFNARAKGWNRRF